MPGEASGRAGSWMLIAAGIAAGLLYLAGAVALGTPPRAEDNGAQVVAWVNAHGDGVRWYVWTLTISVPFFAVMFALLRGLLPAPHRDVFFLGAITFVATTTVQAWSWGGLALHPRWLEPGTARTVLDVAIFWGPVLTGATMTMIAPVTLLALSHRVGLPRWLGILGLVVFAEQAVETATIFGATGFRAPGGEMNVLLGAGLVATWLLAFAFWGGVRGRREEPVRA